MEWMSDPLLCEVVKPLPKREVVAEVPELLRLIGAPSPKRSFVVVAPLESRLTVLMMPTMPLMLPADENRSEWLGEEPQAQDRWRPYVSAKPECQPTRGSLPGTPREIC